MECSIPWHLTDQVEWLVNVEIVDLVQTVGSVSFNRVAVDDIPLLVFTTILFPHLDILSFFILANFNIKYLAVLIVNDVTSFESEFLPPVRFLSSCD
jgi:hypothetical protein